MKSPVERSSPILRRPALALVCAFIAGIRIHRLLGAPALSKYLSIGFGGLILGCATKIQRYRTIIALVGCVVIAYAYAGFRALPDSDDLSFAHPVGAEYIVLEGVVAEGTSSSAHDPSSYFSDELEG